MFVGKDIARLLPCYCCSITGENGPFSQGLRISIIDKSITDIGKDEKRRPAEVKGVTRAITRQSGLHDACLHASERKSRVIFFTIQ